jgi:hypothetical protein
MKVIRTTLGETGQTCYTYECRVTTTVDETISYLSSCGTDLGLGAEASLMTRITLQGRCRYNLGGQAVEQHTSSDRTEGFLA